MSQENVEIVRRIHGLWASDGLAAASELLDPGIEWVNPPDAVEPGTRRGRADVVEASESVNLSFDSVELEVEDFIDAGDHVVVIATMHARGRGSGATVNRRQGYVWTLANGRAVRFSWFNDPAVALEAAGLKDWAMSQENVARLRTALDAYNRDGPEAIISLLAPEVEWIADRSDMGRVTYHGRDGVRKSFEELYEGFDRLSEQGAHAGS